MKKEKFKIYVFNYEYGWEKYIKDTEEKAYEFIRNLDAYEYSQYILVKMLIDRDEVYDTGFIAKPKVKKLKTKRKK